MFYYKLNLFYKDFVWQGSKGTKKKFYITSMVKKYKREKISFMETRCSFFKKKYSNLLFIENGGWHFTCLKTPEELEKKLFNFAHHYEYEESGLKIKNQKK